MGCMSGLKPPTYNWKKPIARKVRIAEGGAKA
jgi:hypothetical protein